jgi:hypothetical protein
MIRKKAKKTSKVTVRCILTGEEKVYRDVQLNKLVVKYKFDDVETFIKYYICKNGIALLRQGYTEKQIREQFNCQDKTNISFNILKHYVKKFKNRQKIEKQEKRKEVLKYMEEKSGAYTWTPKPRQSIDFTSPEQVGELTRSACFRPDIYLNNDRACNGCHIYEFCKCAIRKWNNKLSEPKKRRGQ